MTCSQPARTADRRTSLASPSSSDVGATGITIYDCCPDEAALFREKAPRFGVLATITEEPVSEANVDLALGNRCISVGHKAEVTKPTLLALSRAGVEYISTRSIGCDHVDVEYAKALGMIVGTVAYSPDSVADYTLMLMLMVVRDAKSVIRRAEVHDYRLTGTRGKELRDLTVGVVGTGRIGTAVMTRLRGFGCRVLAHDSRPRTGADYVPLDELLRQSDIVTLHVPLNADTYHLLSRRRVAQLKQGAFVVNTSRVPFGHVSYGNVRSSSTPVAAHFSTPRRSSQRWRAGRWAARRWTSSKVRKGSSTPTAEHGQFTATCPGCRSCRTWSSVRTPPTTRSTPSATSSRTASSTA
jgi:D-specific alpha-keto acid dehydrogenase